MVTLPKISVHGKTTLAKAVSEDMISILRSGGESGVKEAGSGFAGKVAGKARMGIATRASVGVGETAALALRSTGWSVTDLFPRARSSALVCGVFGV
ncbi:hypothetical protein AXG93_1862s1220 [Marchantia polymorpha subsp. ruderalis]|uniref:Uncharacterized protein n=1 Tax=Marchantia polymorpha subsp. ruderalis TaxID=1480154 RepID=A0A176W9W7_MARPO|nr:hypothetical protein AXG93_1862s1220 [Marchantia polymorpha subsp. ruderalis]